MDYFVQEIQLCDGVQKTAGIKARDDLDEIFSSMNFTPLKLSTKQRGNHNKLIEHWNIFKAWQQTCDNLKCGDRVFIQFPVVEHSVFLGNYLKKLRNRGITVVLIIHDLEIIRWGRRKDASLQKKIRYHIEEVSALKACSIVIAHNDCMKDFLVSIGIDESKIISLQIFDYLIPNYNEARMKSRNLSKEKPIIIAGALKPHKVGYVYDLPENCKFNLYGVGYEGPINEKIQYLGAFMPDEIPYVMYGSFGLVWDGNSSETCSGAYGEYLKINNPHKTSLYLASGIPVIIWREAALARFIENNNCGVIIDSLQEINEKVSALTAEEYDAIKKNAEKVGKCLRDGFYTKAAIKCTRI